LPLESIEEPIMRIIMTITTAAAILTGLFIDGKPKPGLGWGLFLSMKSNCGSGLCGTGGISTIIAGK
jgi:hypothetical protein